MRKPVFLMSADERIAALGFRKVHEHPLCVQYERENTKFGYTEVLEFGHKKSGKHLVFLYEKKTNSDGFSNVIGMAEQELKAAVKKLKELGW